MRTCSFPGCDVDITSTSSRQSTCSADHGIALRKLNHARRKDGLEPLGYRAAGTAARPHPLYAKNRVEERPGEKKEEVNEEPFPQAKHTVWELRPELVIEGEVSVPARMVPKDPSEEHRASIGGRPVSIMGDGDNHFPIHDPYVTAAKIAFMRDVKPEVYVNVGDLLDCWLISRYTKEADRLFSGYGARLQEEVDSARPFVNEVCGIVKQGHYLIANHERRSGDIINANPALHGLKSMGWERILEYPANLKIHPYGTMLKAGDYPLYYAHGDQLVPKSVKHPCQWLLANRINRTTIFGHSHKVASAFKTGYDENGEPVTYGAINQGHGSLVSEQIYAGPEPDWLHGFTYTEGFTVDGKARFTIHLITVIDGRFSWGGKVYDGRKWQ